MAPTRVISRTLFVDNRHYGGKRTRQPDLLPANSAANGPGKKSVTQANDGRIGGSTESDRKSDSHTSSSGDKGCANNIRDGGEPKTASSRGRRNGSTEIGPEGTESTESNVNSTSVLQASPSSEFGARSSPATTAPGDSDTKTTVEGSESNRSNGGSKNGSESSTSNGRGSSSSSTGKISGDGNSKAKRSGEENIRATGLSKAAIGGIAGAAGAVLIVAVVANVLLFRYNNMRASQ